MNYQLTQKAYQINFSKIEEGYQYSERICYAENLNKAKYTLLSQLKNDFEELTLKYSDDEVTYLNIPVIRCKEADKFLFEEKEITLYQIDEILNERNRIADLDKILNDNSISHCYIKKGSYYRPNSCGYTDFLVRAGVYTKQEAVAHAKHVREIKIIPIDIDEHNKMIEAEISDLKMRIIPTIV